MKLALGFILRNEMFLIDQVLRLLAREFDGVLADDYGSTDGTLEVLDRHGVDLVRKEWRSDYSAARNSLVGRADSAGFDYILMLDGDEAIWPHDVAELREVTSKAAALRRINLLPKGRWQAHSYPDWQVRMIRCGGGVVYRQPVHEVPFLGQYPVLLGDDCSKLSASIYHYSLLKPASSVWLKEENYRRIQNGLEPDWTIPVPADVVEVHDPKGVEYTGKLPI